MNSISYKKILYFENKRRISLLEKYRSNVLNYFKNISFPKYTGGYSYSENDKARVIRQKINQDTEEICIIFESANNLKDKWLVINIFDLHKYHTSHKKLIDVIDRVISIYKKDTNFSLIRTVFLPIFCLIWLFQKKIYYLLHFKELICEIIKFLNKIWR